MQNTDSKIYFFSDSMSSVEVTEGSPFHFSYVEKSFMNNLPSNLGLIFKPGIYLEDKCSEVS